MKQVKERFGIKVLTNKLPDDKVYPEFLNEQAAQEVRAFHRSMKEYGETPLAGLDHLADKLGVAKIFVKDESRRFGLNAFKGLGGSYAIAKVICKKLNINIDQVNFEYFLRPEVQEKIKDMVFVTATDGNHGRGIAWAAAKVGCKAVVFMPKGSSLRRLAAIQAEGAEAGITEWNYDDTVRYASKIADEKGWYLMQDTAWEGYEEIPSWITRGYLTMADEALEQMKSYGFNRPTHVFLQAGVGSMAVGVLGYYANKFRNELPFTVIIEPTQAACFFESILADDGKPHAASGDLNTIMAGLACGEPSIAAWEILRSFAAAYAVCPDFVSAEGMRLSANPQGSDRNILSGESGAVGIGLLSALMGQKELSELKDELKLNQDSVVLMFSTEGNTDPERYTEIVEEGKYPSVF